MITGPIKLIPESLRTTFSYTAPDGSHWNAASNIGAYVQVWTTDGWGTIQTDNIRESVFREKWSEYKSQASVGGLPRLFRMSATAEGSV